MNPNLTEIVMILDSSGSMLPLTDDTIGGYNAFLDTQRPLPGQAVVTTVFFSDGYDLVHDHIPLEEIKPITRQEYRPCGMTALYDAVGRTIDRVGRRLADTPEDQRPSKVIFVITTDGEENVSREYTKRQIKDMITRQQNVYSWQFIFIGAGIDAYQASSGIGISSLNTASFGFSEDSLCSSYSAMSKGVSSIRATGCLDAAWKAAEDFVSPNFADITAVTSV